MLGFLAAACRTPPPATATRSYPHVEQDFPNPERGFFVDIDLVGGRDFSEVRAQGYTLGHAGVRLDDYRDRPLPRELLDALTAGLARARSAGIKVILRFVYNSARGGADASKAQIRAHLRQLEPILAANADVIAVLEAGFIGAWGEWHHSTHQLDNKADRNEILAAILDALPASRSTTVRRPAFKADAYGGPLTAGHAFDGSPASRVGHLNECFLASASDYGTYAEPLEAWKAFVAEEGRFTPVGGETCKLNPPRTDCPIATAELAQLHLSFLNAQYHPDVLAGWAAQGCLAEIARSLGYRIELRGASFQPRVRAGDVLHVKVSLQNTGYAAMFNARPVFLMLDEQAVPTSLDPRGWEPGTPVDLAIDLRIPAGTSLGRHRLALWLPDADPRLRQPGNVASYSVRLANAKWIAPYNVLTEDLVVEPAASGRRSTRGVLEE